MTWDELQGDMNDLIIGSKEEQRSARLRIVAEFDRLTEGIKKQEWLSANLRHYLELAGSGSSWKNRADELKQENERLKKHCSHLVDDCLDFFKEKDVQPDTSL